MFHRPLILLQIVKLILFIVDSRCTKHMTGNLKLLCNFVEKYLGTVRFGNDQFAPIIRYGDLVQGNITINKVYYVEGLNHNLFLVGQFCDADLEVAFRKNTYLVRGLQGNDLLTGNRGSDLYTISLQETTSPTPVYFMAKASPTQAWLWHRRLSHLNFDYINLLPKKDIVIGLPKLKYVKDQLCSSCELSKAKRSSFKTKVVPSSKGRLNLLHMDLCGPMRVESINWKQGCQTHDPTWDRFCLCRIEIVGSNQDRTSSVNKSSSPSDNSKQQDTPPTATAQSTIEPITPTTTVTAKENNTDNQVDNAHVDDNKFYNVFSTPVREEAELSSRHVDPSNRHRFYQPYQSEHRWTKDHPTAELKNIKEAMADSAWIKAMQDELHQFDRLQVWELVDKPFGKTVIKLK
ncbi:integrase, catalytic region, zinc finger, CCHC-type containing protein, partial [Tanacetum coccineum]